MNSYNVLIEKLTDAAQQFRLGHPNEAYERFELCLQLLGPLFPILEHTSDIESKMADILAARDRQDWLSIADTLEYELPQLLNRFRADHPI